MVKEDRAMSEYDRERIARLFDNMTDAKSITREYATRLGKSIPQIAAEVAFQKLELGHEDVLLDVGTGTGDKAIAAARVCQQVIGIDVSRRSLERARMRLEQESPGNVVFAYGGFEDPCAELDLVPYGITKILAVYSLHHLPDQLKKQSLLALRNLLAGPGRIVIADIMFFEDPNDHRAEFDDVHYDAGDTDFPARVEYLTECLEQTGARVQVKQIHPLVGVMVADFT
jgi:SAM-dependent methyltransferase